MKSQLSVIGMLALILTLFSGCAAIEGIFKAGVGVGVFIVVAVVAIIIYVISKMGKK